MDEKFTYVKTCPDCGSDTIVYDSRERSDGTLLRRRECTVCGYRYRTVEIEESMVEDAIEENRRLWKTIQQQKEQLERLKNER